MPSKRKKKFKWLDIEPDQLALQYVVDVFKVLPWYRFDHHVKCDFKDSCFFCGIRSLCMRITAVKGPKTVTASELNKFRNLFCKEKHINDLISSVLALMTENDDHLKRYFSLHLFCHVMRY